MKYCVPCEQKVNPTKVFSWGWFLFTTLIFFWIAGIWVYPIYYFFFKRKQCPICLGKSFKSKEPHQEVRT